MKFYNFGRSILGHNYYILNMYGPCTEVEKIHTKFVKIGKVVLEKKIITHDRRQPIAIGHLSDSGDLKFD